MRTECPFRVEGALRLRVFLSRDSGTAVASAAGVPGAVPLFA
jgi:hypothetical protein